ncbi:hypothetical protein [Methylomonas albis]|uniref:CheR-type methyltransferase domain-containing protein n=1 Tax=Methylomonas albis TaxID=1854563 RepID=A0ABR9D1P7_9GAMM|nr:hypothetical protein [Methylomonas albis]MBD9357050.1 hypothetical protein [Methylomonas albis]
MNEDDFLFSDIPASQFKNLIILHVLEYFSDAADVMRKFCNSAKGLGIEKIFIIVLGGMGYASDKIHRTFIDNSYVPTNHLEFLSGYKLTSETYFPLPFEFFGKIFICNELKLIYDKA